MGQQRPPVVKLLWSADPCLSLLSYNPYDGPNEHPEAELPLVAGKYLYVYGDMDDDGFYEGMRKKTRPLEPSQAPWWW